MNTKKVRCCCVNTGRQKEPRGGFILSFPYQSESITPSAVESSKTFFSPQAEKTLLTSPTPSTSSFPLPKGHSGEPRPFNNSSSNKICGTSCRDEFPGLGSRSPGRRPAGLSMRCKYSMDECSNCTAGYTLRKYIYAFSTSRILLLNYGKSKCS